VNTEVKPITSTLLVWRKLAIPGLVGNIAEPLTTLVAFVYGLGALVGNNSSALKTAWRMPARSLI
jgi:hypothetical protein